MSESKSFIDVLAEYREEDDNHFEEVEEVRIEDTNITSSGPPLEVWVPANYADTQATIRAMQFDLSNLESRVVQRSDFDKRMDTMMELFQQQHQLQIQQQQQFVQSLNPWSQMICNYHVT